LVKAIIILDRKLLPNKIEENSKNQTALARVRAEVLSFMQDSTRAICST